MTDNPDTYPRAIPLTSEQLRRAYAHAPGMDRFFAALARTRIAMLEQETEREPADEEGE